MKNLFYLFITVLCFAFSNSLSAQVSDFDCSPDDNIAGVFTKKRNISASTYWPRVGQVVTFSIANGVPSGGSREWTFSLDTDGDGNTDVTITPNSGPSPYLSVVGGSLTSSSVAIVFNCRIPDVCVNFHWDKGFGRWFSAWRTVYITSNYTNLPITGPSSVSCGVNQNLTYSINHTGSFQMINWAFPSGWTTSNGTNTISTTGTAVSVNTNAAGGGTIYANFLTPTICAETIGVYSKNVNSTPAELTISGPSSICPGLAGFSIYSVTSTPGYSYSWSTTGVLTIGGGTTGSSVNVWAPLVSSGSGTVNCSITSTCGNANLSKSVTVQWSSSCGGGFTPVNNDKEIMETETVDSYLDNDINEITLEQNRTNETSSVLNVFPNPTSDLAKIEFLTEKDNSIVVELFAANGQKVKVISNQTSDYSGIYTIEFDMSTLSEGVYYIRVLNGNEIMTKTVIKS